MNDSMCFNLGGLIWHFFENFEHFNEPLWTTTKYIIKQEVMILSPSLRHMNFSLEVSSEKTQSPKFGSKCINNLFFFFGLCIFTSFRISLEELILIPTPYLSHMPWTLKCKKLKNVHKFVMHYITKFNSIPYGKPFGVHHPSFTHLHGYEKKNYHVQQINICLFIFILFILKSYNNLPLLSLSI
jgi:hypothetical protein